jgi:hypothetical protein
MAALAIGCSLMSAYHDFVFWRWAGRGVLVSVALTLCFVGYNALSLSLWRGNRRWYIAALGVVVMGFTMSATAIASYELQETATVVDTSAIDAREALLDAEATEAQAAIDAAVKEAEAWKASSWKRADAARKDEQEARARLAAVRAKQETLAGEKEAAREGKTDSGLWAALAQVLGGDAGLIRFLILVIPAMFLDILPPVMVDCMGRKHEKLE